MKISVVIASGSAPENAFVVWRGFEESIRKAAACGYDGVELALGGAGDVNEKDINRWLRAAGLEISCISTGLVYAREGLYMTSPDGDVRRRTVETFLGLIRLAEAWGGLVNIGRARGFVAEGQTRAQAQALFLDCMEALLGEAQKRGVTLIVEPVNRYETNFINSVEEAARLLSRLHSPHVGIMADVFHMNIEDTYIPLTLIKHSALVRYLHMADSNRRAPGMGHTPFMPILRALRQSGYDGWLGVEVLPGDNPDETAAAAARYLRALLAATDDKQEGDCVS